MRPRFSIRPICAAHNIVIALLAGNSRGERFVSACANWVPWERGRPARLNNRGPAAHCGRDARAPRGAWGESSAFVGNHAA